MARVAVVSTCIIPSPPSPHMYGGVEYVSSLRARWLAEEGHEVVLLCARGSRASWWARWGRPPSNVVFVECLREEDYLNHLDEVRRCELVIDDSWLGLVAERLPDRSLKVWHGPRPPRMCELAGRVAFAGVSRAHAWLIERETGVEAGFIYNAIDLSEYSFSEEKSDFLLYLNRVDREKGAHEFIRLCERLGSRGVVAGEDWLVADRGLAEQVLKSYGRVEVLGRVPHRVKVELLRRARAVVAPLAPWYFEVFGLYAVEANACGTPVAARPSGALREVATGGFSNDLAEALELASRVSPRECRESAERFDYRRVWRRLLSDAEELVTRFTRRVN